MAAPNAQPCGSRPGPAAVHEHAPFEGGKPTANLDPSNKPAQGVAGHGTPKPVGNGKKNPLR